MNQESDSANLGSIGISKKNLNLDPNITLINGSQLKETIDLVDSIFFSKFDKNNLVNQALVEKFLKYEKRIILSQESLDLIELEKIKANDLLIITDKQNLKSIGVKDSLKSLSVSMGIDILSTGLETTLYNRNNDFRIVNSRSTKLNNYKDVLTILIAVLSTKNSLWDSMKGAVSLLDIASKLKEKKGEYYEDIDTAFNWCLEF
jgi:hypothetical protein